MSTMSSSHEMSNMPSSQGNYNISQSRNEAETEPFLQEYHPAQPISNVAYHGSQPVIEEEPLGPTPMTHHAPSCPHDHLAPALIVCLCCSWAGILLWPTSIAGLVFAVMVNYRYNAGDYKGSQKASYLALLFVMISFVTGVAIIIGLTVIYFIGMIVMLSLLTH